MGKEVGKRPHIKGIPNMEAEAIFLSPVHNCEQAEQPRMQWGSEGSVHLSKRNVCCRLAMLVLSTHTPKINKKQLVFTTK